MNSIKYIPQKAKLAKWKYEGSSVLSSTIYFSTIRAIQLRETTVAIKISNTQL